MSHNKNIAIGVVVAVAAIAIGVALAMGWLGSANRPSASSPTPTPSPAAVRTIYLSFYNPALDMDESGNIICSTQGLVPVKRDIPFTNTPIQDAIRLLLEARPTSEERAKGIVSQFPLESVKLAGASLTNGVLTLTFEDPDHRTGGGSCFVSILSAQVEGTARQFPEVREVRLIPEDLFQP